MKKQPKPIHGWSMVKGGVLDGFCFATRRDAERYVASRWTWSWASGDRLIETRLAPAKKAKRGGK